jgi:hypothetical protein
MPHKSKRKTAPGALVTSDITVLMMVSGDNLTERRLELQTAVNSALKNMRLPPLTLSTAVVQFPNADAGRLMYEVLPGRRYLVAGVGIAAVVHAMATAAAGAGGRPGGAIIVDPITPAMVDAASVGAPPTDRSSIAELRRQLTAGLAADDTRIIVTPAWRAVRPGALAEIRALRGRNAAPVVVLRSDAVNAAVADAIAQRVAQL